MFIILTKQKKKKKQTLWQEIVTSHTVPNVMVVEKRARKGGFKGMVRASLTVHQTSI